mmetsp:Transcript_53784/g.114820  ORF Transcript_53784/g.114820 Transcript_53784/m.114820 type:complete len:329 (-) Transcript_53784:70-1056(-)
MSGEGKKEIPSILVCGSHRAGKTSILQVIFEKKSPHETHFLESGSAPSKMRVDRNGLMRFDLHDLPDAHLIEEGTEQAKLFADAGVTVFVIDVQEDPYMEAISQARRTIDTALKVNPKMSFDVFIHKIDGDQFFSDDQKAGVRTDIETRLNNAGRDELETHVSYHCTSIYDHTIFEAFSKVVQRLLTAQLPPLVSCLDVLLGQSRLERVFLFDAVSKIYIASDPQPVDLQSYELCSDMIDVVVDVSCIYGAEGMAAYSKSESKSACIIHLQNGNLLFLLEIDCCLALVAIIREENFDRQTLLEHNIGLFKSTIDTICQKTTTGVPQNG